MQHSDGYKVQLSMMKLTYIEGPNVKLLQIKRNNTNYAHVMRTANVKVWGTYEIVVHHVTENVYTQL